MKEILNRIAENAVREPTPIPPAKPIPQRQSLKSACLRAFVFGSLPLLIIFVCEITGFTESYVGRIKIHQYLVMLYGLWGFAIGLVHKSFVRMLIGLNVGALIGFVLYRALEFPDSKWEVPLAPSLSYAVLIAIVSFERIQPANSVFRSLCVGVGGKIALFIFIIISVEIVRVLRIENVVTATIVVAVAPFLSLLITFYFLIPIPPLSISSNESQ